MTGFLALVGTDGVRDPGETAWASGHVRLLAEATPRPNGPRVATRGPLALAGDLRLDNRDDLRRALRAPEADDADLVLRAYERWGDTAVDHLIGPFSFLLWDEAAGRALAARDGVGLRPLFRARVGGGWAFGSSLPTLQALVSFQVDAEGAADYLAGDTTHPTRTLVAGVERVPGGHLSTFRLGDAPQDRRFWTFDRPERLPDDDRVVEEAFREAFDQAVLARLGGNVGAFLSGGLDSSSIVTTVRALRPDRPLDTFSLLFESGSAHERPYIDAVAESAGVRSHRVDGASALLLPHLDADLAAFGQPPMAPNLFLTRHLYHQVHEAGLDAVLDGFGGDNIVGHGLDWLTELALGFRWITFARTTAGFVRRARHPGRRLRRLVRTYAVEPLVGSFPRATPTVQFGRQARPDDEPVRRPRTAREAHMAELASGSLGRLFEEAFATATAVGVEPRFPFLDRRVVEVCLAVPPSQHLRDGLTRSYLRRSMAARLPPAILQRSSKARFGDNFVDSVFARDTDFVEHAIFEDAPGSADILDVKALQATYREAMRTPHLREPIAPSFLRAVCLARWAAQARSGSPPSA